MHMLGGLGKIRDLLDLMNCQKKVLGEKIEPALTAEELAEKQIIDSKRDALQQRSSDLEIDMEAVEVERKLWWRKVERARNISSESDLRIDGDHLHYLKDKEESK